jgi:hypothetical protein
VNKEYVNMLEISIENTNTRRYVIRDLVGAFGTLIGSGALRREAGVCRRRIVIHEMVA